jgi:hypothetical protein
MAANPGLTGRPLDAVQRDLPEITRQLDGADLDGLLAPAGGAPLRPTAGDRALRRRPRGPDLELETRW